MLSIIYIYAYIALILYLVCANRLRRSGTHKLYAKVNPVSSNDKFEKARNYIRMKQVMKKDSSLNATISSDNNLGYKKFLGKGTLDQRLRAIVSYKRTSAYTALDDDNVLTPQEEEELIEFV